MWAAGLSGQARPFNARPQVEITLLASAEPDLYKLGFTLVESEGLLSSATAPAGRPFHQGNTQPLCASRNRSYSRALEGFERVRVIIAIQMQAESYRSLGLPGSR